MCQFFKANTTNFIMFRTILRQASFMANASKAAAALCPGLKVVSPHEASYLARVAGGSDNDNMVAFLADTLADSVQAPSSKATVGVTLRNDGWNVLPAHTTHVTITVADPKGAKNKAFVPLTTDLGVGATAHVTAQLRKNVAQCLKRLHSLALLL
eukprot:m.352297 g.352297  ORF g.352297 m.352297 type:complete len:155 (-) comp19901_c0_seq17:31-495(-)